jgi:phosphoribosylamine-glycine ligase
MQEQDRRIHDPELTHHMAYAEKPFRDLAEQAIRIRMEEVHNEALRRANAASVLAGREYLAGLQASVEFFGQPTTNTNETITSGVSTSPESSQAEQEEDDGPEYMTVSQMRRSFGVGYDVAKAAVEILQETLGEVAQTEFSRGGRGRRSGEPIEIFNREQRAKIADYLRE